MDSDNDEKIRIVVLDRGFVFVGRCPDVAGCGLWITMTDARCVRVWGTSRGLGELVAGPTPETRLDDMIPSLTFAVRALICTLNDVDQKAWATSLKPSPAAATTPSADSSSRTGSRRRATA